MQTVFLHVGAPKTGTTFLQRVLWRNRERLAADGACYPLRGEFEHLPATLDLRRMRWGGRWDPRWDGAWQRVTQRARTWTGPTVLLSNELLGGATKRQARQAVESFRPAELHVVVTVRDLARQLPSGWQEHLKHRHAMSFDEFLDDLLTNRTESRSTNTAFRPLLSGRLRNGRLSTSGAGGRYGRAFWSLHDVTEVLRRWNAAVPANRIHVVTVPPPDAPKGLLWDRFATVVGIDAGRYETAVPRSNASVGVAEAGLLRRINQAPGGQLPGRSYDQTVRLQLAESILAARPRASRIVLPARRYPWALERSRRVIADVRAAGYDVVGDLDDLLPAPPPETDGVRHPDDATTLEILEVAVEAMADLVRRAGPMRPRERELHARVHVLEQELRHRRRRPITTLLRDIRERIGL